jgi:hypothetical protein
MRLIRRAVRKQRLAASRPGRDLADPIADPIEAGMAGPGTETLSSYEIPPEVTDPTIDNWTDTHFVAFDTHVAARNKLFLFLCGSYGIPARQRLIIQLAAHMGYHAVNLSYPNSWTVAGLCRDSEDRDCHGEVRLEIFDGVPRSGLVDIGAANSIVNRLAKLLGYLEAKFSEQGWSQYLGQDGIQWDAVVVAGHSQGGGQAAIIAKQHLVDRVVMFASPVDYVRRGRAHATWLAEPGVTPAERYFGFVHRGDNGFERIQSAWEMLGMAAGGPIVDIDEHKTPYAHSQRLVTDVGYVRRNKYHGCVVQDNLTPAEPDGTLVFEPVWRYLLGG